MQPLQSECCLRRYFQVAQEKAGVSSAEETLARDPTEQQLQKLESPKAKLFKTRLSLPVRTPQLPHATIPAMPQRRLCAVVVQRPLEGTNAEGHLYCHNTEQPSQAQPPKASSHRTSEGTAVSWFSFFFGGEGRKSSMNSYGYKEFLGNRAPCS